MHYAEARAEIQSGDLLAWRGESCLGRLVRHWTGSRWSHVGVAWRFRGRLFVLDARHGAGVGLRAVSNVPKPFDWIKTGVDWSDKAESVALSHLGKPYSYEDFFRAALMVPPGDPWGDICSEYAGRVLAAVNPKWRLLVEFGRTTSPGSLVNEVLSHGFAAELRTVTA